MHYEDDELSSEELAEYTAAREAERLTAVDYFETNYTIDYNAMGKDNPIKLAKYNVEEDGKTEEKIFYFYVSNIFTYVDAPFALTSEIQDLSEEMCQWGISKIGAAQTYHLVLPTDAVRGDSIAFQTLMNLMLSDAREREKYYIALSD